MQRMEMLLSKTPPTDVKNDVLPMIYRALESDASQIQELCLSIIPGFAGTYLLFHGVSFGSAVFMIMMPAAFTLMLFPLRVQKKVSLE